MGKQVVHGGSHAGAESKAGWVVGMEAVAAMVKALTAPVVLVIVGLAFFDPISQIVHMLPAKFRDADKFSAAGLTLEIERKASAAGNPKLAELVGDLSRTAITTLLRTTGRRGILSYSNQTDGSRFFYLPDQAQIKAMEELERKGLLECAPSISVWEAQMLPLFEKATDRDAYVLKNKDNNERHDASCGLSPAGIAASELVIDAVAQQISSSRKPSNN